MGCGQRTGASTESGKLLEGAIQISPYSPTRRTATSILIPCEALRLIEGRAKKEKDRQCDFHAQSSACRNRSDGKALRLLVWAG